MSMDNSTCKSRFDFGSNLDSSGEQTGTIKGLLEEQHTHPSHLIKRVVVGQLDRLSPHAEST